jgi:hypothetical protein
MLPAFCLDRLRATPLPLSPRCACAFGGALPLKTPTRSSIPPGDIPTLRQLGFSEASLQRAASDKAAAAVRLWGGERQAQEAVQVRRRACAVGHFALSAPPLLRLPVP